MQRERSATSAGLEEGTLFELDVSSNIEDANCQATSQPGNVASCVPAAASQTLSMAAPCSEALYTCTPSTFRFLWALPCSLLGRS